MRFWNKTQAVDELNCGCEPLMIFADRCSFFESATCPLAGTHEKKKKKTKKNKQKKRRKAAAAVKSKGGGGLGEGIRPNLASPRAARFYN